MLNGATSAHSKIQLRIIDSAFQQATASDIWPTHPCYTVRALHRMATRGYSPLPTRMAVVVDNPRATL